MKKNIFFKKKQNKKLSFFIFLIVPLVLCGCHTMEGAGTDIKQAGKALERSAERNKECSHPCPYCSQPTCSPR